MKWVQEEIELLEIWLNQGYTHKEIANELHRTINSIHLKANRLSFKSKNKQLKTHETFISEMLLVNININFLTRYINTKTKITCQCLIDGHIWEALPRELLRDKGCPVCKAVNNAGLYGNMDKIAADKLNYPLYLYHVKLQYENEIFYKYGLTKNNDRSRFKDYGVYKVIEELSFIEYDAWEAICKEQELKTNYIPLHHFGGHNECYVKD